MGDMGFQGSATKANVINLNINLLNAPESVIDYIILHELCHLKIKEHSHHFWDMLHKFIPDYQEKVEWLRINGSRLVDRYLCRSNSFSQGIIRT